MYHFNKCSSFANNELQSLLHHSSGNFKILMITGMMQDRTNPTAASEVINVESSTSVTCPAVPNFPSAIYASAGTLIQKKMPLVCSGYNLLFTQEQCLGTDRKPYSREDAKCIAAQFSLSKSGPPSNHHWRLLYQHNGSV